MWCTGAASSCWRWPGSRWCCRSVDRAVVLAAPALGGDLGGELFYLVPAVTAVMAYVLFAERLDPIAIAGMVACAAAVFLVNRRA
jgi:EamA-like transporter family.